MCRHDLLTRAGGFRGITLPVTLGHQVSGHVARVGANVHDFAPGDRVMTMIYTGCGGCEACAMDNDGLCTVVRPAFLGEDCDGGYADFVAVRSRIVIPVPDNVPLAQAAIATCTLGTAYHALATRGRLIEGESVVITGASGGVGIHAIEAARMLGGTVVGVASTKEKAALVERAGAHEVIVSPERTFAREVRARLGRQADLVVDVVGAATLRESMHAVRPGGRVIVLGNVEGKQATIPPTYLILKEISLLGTKSCIASDMRTLLAALSAGQLHADVADTVPLERGMEIHARMETGDAKGRLVMAVAGE